MSLLCNLGLHSWEGCKCIKCGKVRDEQHSWKKDDCSICEKCGKDIPGNHSWDGCKCKNCGKILNENHTWKKDDCNVCNMCGKRRNGGHDWSEENGKCSKCGKIGYLSTNNSSYKCECGNNFDLFTIINKSKYDFYECSNCGKGILFINNEKINLFDSEINTIYLGDHKIMIGYFGGEQNSSTIVECFNYVCDEIRNRDFCNVLLVFTNSMPSSIPNFSQVIQGSPLYVLPFAKNKVIQLFENKKIAIVLSVNQAKSLSYHLIMNNNQNMKLFKSVKDAYAWLNCIQKPQ